MTIRLNKVTRDLNVGLTTVVEFLQKKGFEVEATPNTQITKEQYELLVQEFRKDKKLRIESEKFSQERQSKERGRGASISIDGFDEPKKEPERKAKEDEVVKTVVPEDVRPKFKPVGKIDLDALNRRKKPAQPVVEKTVEKNITEKTEEKKAAQQPAPEKAAGTAEPKDEAKAAKPVRPEAASAADKPAPVKTEKADTQVAEKVEEKKGGQEDDGVFKIRPTEFVSKINVVGQIDLDALNQSTRPRKKSKEERRKEREEKEKQRQEQKKQMKDAIIKEIRKTDDKSSRADKNDSDEDGKRKKKRSRINKEKVDINAVDQSSHGEGRSGKGGGGEKSKDRDRRGKDRDRNRKSSSFAKPEVSDEDVAKQVKETLARLTSKGKNKTSKYRKEKRENAINRQQELEDQERAESKVLKLTEFVTANELANMMNVPVTQVIGTCMSVGIMVSINQRLDAETINLVAEEFGFQTEYVSAEVAQAVVEEEDRAEDLQPRAPIVTVMGHVDHGKTSLLDYIRKSNVIAGEAGGITQHIGAYNVKLEDGRRITFLDTPGHEAFTAMRARGAKVTDIAIIIVAADDNVMPQTIEAINHAQAAGAPMVFAINKIDKPGANPDHIKEQLAQMNYLVESWGGKYQDQEISAKKGINLDKLLEKALLEAEMLIRSANPNKKAVGTVIESTLDKGRGYVSTVLVQGGTLHVGDVILSGTYTGRVKAMFNENGKKVTEAGPSTPVQVLGLNGAPQAGDSFNVMDDDRSAREIANKREQLQRMQGIMTQKHVTLDEIGRRIAIGSFKELNIIVKGDVDGSVEAMSGSLIKLSKESVQVNVIHAAVGQISESDVLLAAASNAIIVGFQVRPSAAARKLAESEEIEIRLYSIIYDAINDIKDAIEGMLEPVMKEEIVASVEVMEIFKISKVGTVAGCIVREGKLTRNTPIRVIRDGIVIYTGKLGSLKRFKDDVKEVTSGQDCGLNIESFNDVKIGDIIEGYEQVEVKRTK